MTLGQFESFLEAKSHVVDPWVPHSADNLSFQPLKIAKIHPKSIKIVFTTFSATFGQFRSFQGLGGHMVN